MTLEQYSTCIGTSLNSFNPYEYLMTDLKLTIDKEEFSKAVKQRHSKLMELETIRPVFSIILIPPKQLDCA
ncbi:hypothetical protein [Paenibacillus etheri]|uniref:hypothetical protein n=1 Tax=Paenibacillus etheri TaxID=1306852 RepID=UPI000AE2B0BF|nr:hypothetical protein [Paenibacillus etheri]